MEGILHILVPHFLLENDAQDKRQGSFAAVGLFVDVSGFSAMADAMMQQGQHGAEVLAEVMRAIFHPLINSVYAQGGFVATLAGDAFTALFPLHQRATAVHQQALAAAWQIQAQMNAQPRHYTPYGDFAVAAKVGLATGVVYWGIVAAEDDTRAVYYFQGPAVDGCAAAEHLARAGQILMTADAFAQVQALVTAIPVADHFQITAVTGALPAPQPVALPPVDATRLSRFYPPEVITQRHSGEFREVVNVFVSLPTVRTEAQLAIFMQTVFDLQDHYGGLLNGLDFGDKGSNLLLFWGAPVAHENDIARALNFLLDLQTQTSIPLNAGVTYQIAYAGFNGSALREDYTCFGRGVSLAARFMTTAARGEIWLDEPVARRAAAHFEVEFSSTQSFKGFATPQKIYLLLERKVETDTFYTGALVGRQAELAQLRSFVQPIFNGASAGLLVVTGEPGIGKSRLVHEFLAQQQPSDFALFLCQTDEILRESFNPLRYWLRSYFSVSALQVEARNKRSFNRKLDALIAATTAAPLADELDRTRSCLAALVGLHWPDSLYAQQDAKWRYENTLAGVITLLHAESRQQPVVLLVEDAHWLDEDSKLLLARLRESLAAAGEPPYPIAILATARNEGTALLPAAATSYPQIDLAGLTRADLAQVAQALLDGPAQPLLLDLLEERAEGNPFFAEQILRDVQERGLLAQRADGWTIHATDLTSLPTDVRAVLVARLDRLTRTVRSVVQTAAVLGREFEVRLLTHMLQDDIALSAKVTQAEQAAIWSALSEIRYLFKHALLRDAAYRMQVRAQRRQLHRLAAEAYVQLYGADSAPHYGSIAYHYENTYQLGEHAVQDQAFAYLQKAGQQAMARFENAAAVDYFNRALVLLATLAPTPERDQQELMLHVSLGQALIVAKGWGHADVVQTFNRARELCEQMGNSAQLFPILLGLAAYNDLRAQHQISLALGEQMLEIIQHQSNTAFLIAVHVQMALNLCYLGRLMEARSRTEQWLTRYNAEQHHAVVVSLLGADPAVLGFGLLGLVLWLLGYLEQALTRLDEALALAHALAHPYSLALALNVLMGAHQVRGETAAARACAMENIALCTEQGMPLWIAPSMCTVGWALAIEGETDAGIAQMKQGLDLMDAMGTIALRPLHLTHLIAVLAKAGQLDEGLALVNEALSPASKGDQSLFDAELHRLKGDLLWAQGAAAEKVEAWYHQAIEIAQHQAAKLWELRATMSLCRFLQQQGRQAEGRQRLAEIYGWFTEGFATQDLIEAKALLIALDGDIEPM